MQGMEHGGETGTIGTRAAGGVVGRSVFPTSWRVRVHSFIHSFIHSVENAREGN